MLNGNAFKAIAICGGARQYSRQCVSFGDRVNGCGIAGLVDDRKNTLQRGKKTLTHKSREDCAGKVIVL